MSPWNLRENKSIAPKHLSQLQLLKTSFWKQTRQEPGPDCERRKVCNTGQQQAKRQKEKQSRMAKKRAFPAHVHRWAKEIRWRPAANQKALTPSERTEMPVFCSVFKKTGGPNCKACRKMVHWTWRQRGACELFLLPPYFLPEATGLGKAFRETRHSLTNLFQQTNRETYLSSQGRTETTSLDWDKSSEMGATSRWHEPPHRWLTKGPVHLFVWRKGSTSVLFKTQKYE